jgi:hypothetical protein
VGNHVKDSSSYVPTYIIASQYPVPSSTKYCIATLQSKRFLYNSKATSGCPFQHTLPLWSNSDRCSNILYLWQILMLTEWLLSLVLMEANKKNVSMQKSEVKKVCNSILSLGILLLISVSLFSSFMKKLPMFFLYINSKMTKTTLFWIILLSICLIC